MVSEDLLSHSQAHATSEAVQSCWTSILIYSHLLLGLPSGLFLQVYPPKPYFHLSCSHTCYLLRQSHSSWSDHTNIWWGVQIINGVKYILELMNCASTADQGSIRSNWLSIYTQTDARWRVVAIWFHIFCSSVSSQCSLLAQFLYQHSVLVSAQCSGISTVFLH
jgi:hypothetical protein